MVRMRLVCSGEIPSRAKRFWSEKNSGVVKQTLMKQTFIAWPFLRCYDNDLQESPTSSLNEIFVQTRYSRFQLSPTALTFSSARRVINRFRAVNAFSANESSWRWQMNVTSISSGCSHGSDRCCFFPFFYFSFCFAALIPRKAWLWSTASCGSLLKQQRILPASWSSYTSTELNVFKHGRRISKGDNSGFFTRVDKKSFPG